MFFSLILASTASLVLGADVPGYVNKYAPMVYLFSGENYNPSDIGAQLTNTHPELNLTALDPNPNPTLENLNELNDVPNSDGGVNIYLTSNSDPTTIPGPAYLAGVKPDAMGKTNGAISCAIVTVAHPENQTLDAFYFYFYAFNYGGSYPFVGVVGNHIGDWEHNMIRFNSTTQQPLQIWYSQHSSGEAFTYAAAEKYEGGVRPVAYSANGTHANYAIAGTHDHTIPGINLPYGPIEDHTDNGTAWDPTANAYYFSFTPSSESTSDDAGSFTAYNSSEPVNWLYFTGHWGDEMYAKSDKRQQCDLDIDALCKWQSGPTGPYFKDLNRAKVCPDSDDHCVVYDILLPRGEEEA